MKNLTSAFIFVLATLSPGLALANGSAVNPIIAKGGCAFNLFTQACVAAGGAGTVTSVGLSQTGPLFTVGGSPVVGAGTLTLTMNTQANHLVLMGPIVGGPSTPTYRLLDITDVPDLSSVYEILANKDTDATMAANSDVSYPSQKAVKTALATKEPTITAGLASQYYRGDKSFQTLDTLACVENTNLYFTQARVLATPITGFVAGAGAVAATDTILQAFNKLAGNQGNFELLANKDTDGTLAANSDVKYASQKAAKTYIDTGLSAKQDTIATDAGAAHQFFNSYAAGVFGKAQPAFSDISGQLGAAQLPTSFDEVFIDYVSGNDANNGSVMAPWKTFAHTCATITPTINVPVVIHVTGGNNDTDAAPISCPPNIAVTADYGIQISQPFTITGGATNDSVAFRNFIFVGALTWIRNDATTITMSLDNSEFFSGPVFKQNGAGTASVVSHDSVFVNGDFVLPGTGSFFYNPTFLGATTKFGDATNAAYYQVMGGYNSSDMQVSGGAQLYLSGLQCDFPFGCALDGTTTAKGTPLFQSDDGSVPASIGGAFTFNPTSHAQHVEYTPTTAGDWSSVPATVLAALDNLASTGVYKSQAANKFFASPNGAPGPMSPRSIVAADVPTLNQNTTGTAANLSGTPALPNGTTATTQAPGDNSTKLATTAYADAAAAGGGISSLNTDVVAAGPGAAVATIQPGVVTNAKMANMAASTIKGNNTGGALAPIDLSIAQVKTLLAYTFSDLSGSVTQAQLPDMVTITKLADYTLLTTDTYVDGNGTFNLTLPVATSVLKQPYVITNIGAGVLTILPNGADTIISIASVTLNPGQSFALKPDGVSNWTIQ